MTVKINAILAETLPPGIYSLGSRARAGTIAQVVERHGWRCFYLDGRQIGDKATFLAASAQAMRFPSYFGHNWDAFEECLTDLVWAPASGYVLLYGASGRLGHRAGDSSRRDHALAGARRTNVCAAARRRIGRRCRGSGGSTRIIF
jgi:hypothetical protein